MTEVSPMAQKSATTNLNKQEAVRRLIHTAIRMIISEEDPFSVHLLIQSADKILIDVAKKLGKELRIDWELFIKGEYHKEFFKKHRAVYNYLKHGKKDASDEIQVEDIQTRNFLDLFALIVNYGAVYAKGTRHMHIFQVFVLQIFPDLIPTDHPSFKDFLKKESAHISPRELFKHIYEHQEIMPILFKERSDDLAILGDFYSLH